MPFHVKSSMSLAAVALLLLAPAAGWAAQPHNKTPSATKPLPLRFEVDYAVAGTSQSANGQVQVDTLVSIGLARTATTKCNVQVQWVDWDDTPAGFSGDGLGVISQLFPGETLEFTTAFNGTNPFAYPPFEQNVFRSTRTSFEGHAYINADCPSDVNLRADAEFVTLTTPAAGGPATANYKVINVSKPFGIIGY